MANSACLLRPVDLRCECLAAPRGLNTLTPEFSWALQGTCQTATAWRIVAGADRKAVTAGLGDLWDSGKCHGFAGFVRWGGDALAPDSRFFWAVQLWDETGQVSALSEPAEVYTGLPNDQWQAQWVARYFVQPAGRDVPQDTEYTNRFQARPADYLRRDFQARAPDRAFVYVSALGLYELYLNGQRIGDDVMAPGWTDYHTRVEYQAHDVTELVQDGANVLGAILGEGWYCGRIGHNQKRAGHHYGGRPALICQLHLHYDDGHVERILSDGSWQTRQGPVCYSDFLAGEMYDARLELGDWARPGYRPQYWQPVECFIPDPNPPQLDAARAPAVREVCRLRPASQVTSAEGGQIYDFGQNLAGYVEMDVCAPAGTEIHLRHGERLDGQGALYTDNLRYAVSEDIYICKGGGPERFKPRFTFHGFQYVEMRATAPIADLTLTAIAIQSDLPLTGDIETGHAMVNQLISNIFWSQRGNLLSVPTDCPQRDERYGWSADAQVFWRTAGYFMDMSGFLRKWIEDLIDGQSPEGAFPDVAPTKPLNPYRLTPQPGAPAWGDGPIIMAWHHWLRYGDHTLLARCWQPFVAWMDYVERHNPDGPRTEAVHNNYGDWLSVGPESDRGLINTAYWVHLADTMAEIAGVLGNDASRWRGLGARLRRLFAEHFIAPDGRLAGHTQTAYLLALDFKVLAVQDRPKAAGHLADLLAEAGGHLQTGFLGVRHLAPVVSDWISPTAAVDLLLKNTYPSWGFSIAQGATSIWERWDGWTPDNGFQSTAMNSFNHYAYGAIGEWIWARLAGIDWSAQAPGFQKVVMRPVFDRRIGHVKASYRAATGEIKSHWTYEGDRVIWAVTLPPSVTGEVGLPDGWQCDGRSQFNLTAGQHRIVCSQD